MTTEGHTVVDAFLNVSAAQIGQVPGPRFCARITGPQLGGLPYCQAACCRCAALPPGAGRELCCGAALSVPLISCPFVSAQSSRTHNAAAPGFFIYGAPDRAQILLTLPNAISKTGFIAGTTLAVGGAICALYTMCTPPLAWCRVRVLSNNTNACMTALAWGGRGRRGGKQRPRTALTISTLHTGLRLTVLTRADLLASLYLERKRTMVRVCTEPAPRLGQHSCLRVLA